MRAKASAVRAVVATTCLIAVYAVTSELDARDAATKQSVCETTAYQAQAGRQTKLNLIMPPAKFFNARIYERVVATSEAMLQADLKVCHE